METIELLLDSNRGVYIPQNFFEIVLEQSNIAKKSNLHKSKKQRWIVPSKNFIWLQSQLMDTDSENYWEAWETVCNCAYFIDKDGKRWTLWQDGDLWAVREDHIWSEEGGIWE